MDQLYEAGEVVWRGEAVRTVSYAAEHMKPGKVLDVGAGEGRNTLYLARLHHHVTALDFSAVGLEKLQERAAEHNLEENIGVIEGNIVSTELPDQYDTIISTYTLHFLNTPDYFTVLERMMEATVPGGLNIIEDFGPNGPLCTPGAEGTWMSLDQLTEYYRSNGWEIERGETFSTGTLQRDEQNDTLFQEAVGLIARKPLDQKPVVEGV